MKASVLLGILSSALVCLSQSTTTSIVGCVSIYPNEKCLGSEPTAKPIIVSNVVCGECYSATVLQNSRNPAGEENSPLIPEAYRELYSGFDFRINCEDDQIDIYRAASKVTAHCYGTPVNYSTWDCVQLAESSLYSTSESCDYSFRYGTTLYPNVRDPVCGEMDDALPATCGNCEPLPYPNEWTENEFYIIDCDNGAITIYDEPDCSVKTTEINMADCHTYKNDTLGINNVQFIPWNVYSLQVCRVFWPSGNCEGEPD